MFPCYKMPRANNTMWCVGIILVVSMRYDYVCKDGALRPCGSTPKKGDLITQNWESESLEKLLSWYSSSPTVA